MKGPSYFDNDGDEKEQNIEIPKLNRQDTPTPSSGTEETYKDSEAVCDTEKKEEDDDDDFERDEDAKENDSLLKDYDKV